MKKTLIIVDHPSFDCSVVHRRWLEEIRKYPDEFTVHNLQSAYPRQHIEVTSEQSLLERSGTVVFEFPLYWYNSPPMTKRWFDSVLTTDWAYGRTYKLEGRKIAFAVSCGSAADDYSADGRHHVSVEDYLNSYVHSLEFIHATMAGCFTFFGASSLKEDADGGVKRLSESAGQYVAFLRGIATGDSV